MPHLNTQASDEITDFMNGPVRNLLGIIPPEVTWHEGKRYIELSTFSYTIIHNDHIMVVVYNNKLEMHGKA